MKVTDVTLVFTVEEAREMVIDLMTETLANDKRLLRDKIASGQMKDAVWNAPMWSPFAVVDKFRELNLGEPIAEQHHASKVMIKITETDYRVVWEAKETPKSEAKDSTVVIVCCGGYRTMRFNRLESGVVKVEYQDADLTGRGDSPWMDYGTYSYATAAVMEVLRKECGW